MAWTFQQHEYPILTPGQMNPFNQAFKSALQSYMDINTAAYQAPQIESKMRSQNAYSENVGGQVFAKLMENPFMMAYLAKANPEDRQKIIQKYMGSITGSNNAQNAQTDQPSPIAQAWSYLTGNQNVPHRTTVQQPVNQGQMPNNNVMSPQEVQTFADNLQPPQMNMQPVQAGQPTQPSQPIQTSAPSMPTNQGIDYSDPMMNAGHVDYGDKQVNAQMAVHKPSVEQEVLKRKLIEQQTKDVSAQSDLWKKRIEESHKQVNSVQNSINTLNKLKDLYPKLSSTEKGVVFGRLPAASSNAQKFDQLAQVQATDNLRALQQGHITDKDFNIGDKLKPGRYMNEAAFKDMADFNIAKAQRAKQELKFMRDAKKAGMSAEDADVKWSEFIESHPLFDNKEKIIKNNYTMSPFDSENKSVKSTAKKFPVPKGAWPSGKPPINGDQLQGQVPPPGTRWFVTPDGYQKAVHESRIGEAQQKRWREINA